MIPALGVAAVIVVVAVALAAVALYRRRHAVDPGAVSYRWISEYRAQQPQEGPGRSH